MDKLQKRLEAVQELEKRGNEIAYNLGEKEARAWLLTHGTSFTTLAAERWRLKKLLAMTPEQLQQEIENKRREFEYERDVYGIEWNYLLRQISQLEAIVLDTRADVA
jgi:uncharacterized protein with von Willebrand factor type A (vWA) domain